MLWYILVASLILTMLALAAPWWGRTPWIKNSWLGRTLKKRAWLPKAPFTVIVVTLLLFTFAVIQPQMITSWFSAPLNVEPTMAAAVMQTLGTIAITTLLVVSFAFAYNFCGLNMSAKHRESGLSRNRKHLQTNITIQTGTQNVEMNAEDQGNVSRIGQWIAQLLWRQLPKFDLSGDSVAS